MMTLLNGFTAHRPGNEHKHTAPRTIKLTKMDRDATEPLPSHIQIMTLQESKIFHFLPTPISDSFDSFNEIFDVILIGS